MAKILASLAFIFLATLAPALASMGPIMLGDYVVFVQDGHIKKPEPFLSIDKFGLRRGGYVLSFKDNGESLELPIYPDKLSIWRNDHTLFANWKTENILCKVAENEGRGPLRVYFSAWGLGGVTIKKIDLMKDLPENIDVPPEQNGWKYFSSGNTKMPSQSELNVDKETVFICLLIITGLMPTAIFLHIARHSIKPYFKN
ncbi:hypothetical protein KA183_16630 [bacterium]|nr:hypothetical protein [bacterium]QQR59201.1 MAG: hypothetical protein IPG59_06830 [Candidatus Melainabacteria bacterium]